MKLQVRLSILIVALLILLISILTYYKTLERRQFSKLSSSQLDEKAKDLDIILQFKSRSLQSFVKNYALGNEVIALVKNPQSPVSQAWAHRSIDVSLNTFDTQGAWVYTMQGTPVYSAHTSAESDNAPCPMRGAMIENLADKQFYHFFVTTSHGLLEVFGSMIYTREDAQRLQSPQGYFFVGRYWDRAYLDEIGRLLRSKLMLVFEEGRVLPRAFDASQGIITFSKMLPSPSGSPAAWVTLTSRLPVMGVLNQALRRDIRYLASAMLVSLMVLFFFLIRWINQPLHSIARTLEDGSLEALEATRRLRGEFGQIARLISRYFQQTERLRQEIRERKVAEARLQYANQEITDTQEQLIQFEKMAAIGQLSVGVAHEVKNPLAIISMGSEALNRSLKKSKDKERELEYVRKIHEAADRANKVIQELLMFSRTSSVQLNPIDIHLALRDTIRFIDNKLKTKHLDIRYDLTSDDVIVMADKILLEQVFMNLLLNAIDAIEASKRTGEIEIKTSVAPLEHSKYQAKKVVISISDTGIGIPDAELPKIFDPFFTTKDEGKGTGLGLRTAYLILKKHCGTIEVSSKRNIGTTFTIMLPLFVPGSWKEDNHGDKEKDSRG